MVTDQTRICKIYSHYEAQYKTYEAVTKELLKKSNLIRDFLNLYKREIYIIGESYSRNIYINLI